MSDRSKGFGELLTDEDFPGNIYAYLAYSAAGPLKRSTSPLTDATAAQAFATLALAHEQRTANLIAAMELIPRGADGRRRVADQIAARLGLAEVQS